MKVGALCIKKGVPILTHPLFIYSAIVGVRRFELPTTRPPGADFKSLYFSISLIFRIYTTECQMLIFYEFSSFCW